MALPKSLEIFRANGSSSQVIPEWLRNEGILSFEGHSKSEWPRMTEMRDEKWDLVWSSFLSKWPWNDCFLSFRPHPVIRDEGWTKWSRQSSIQGNMLFHCCKKGPFLAFYFNYISGSLFSVSWLHSREECQFSLHVYSSELTWFVCNNFLHCYYTYMYLQELVQGYTVGKFWFFSYAYALNFINHCFGSLFWQLGVPIGSLFHKKLGPYFKAWGSLLVLVAVLSAE